MEHLVRFEEDAIAAAEAARQAAAAAAAEAAEAARQAAVDAAEQATRARLTRRNERRALVVSLVRTWFVLMGVDTSKIKFTKTGHKEEWAEPQGLYHGAYPGSVFVRYKYHPAETHLVFDIDEYQFRATVFHALVHEWNGSLHENHVGGSPRIEVAMRVSTGAEEPGVFMPVNTKVEFGEAILEKRRLSHQ